MSIINTTIPSLIGGISQQPDRLKFDGQCKDSLNCYGTVKDGLKKRPYARMVKSIIASTDYDENTFIFFIDRTVIERYVGLYSNENGLKVFNLLTGNEAVVTGSDTYLGTGSLDEDDILKALTVADFTFLLNRSKVVNLGVANSPALATEAMVFIKQGDFEKDYTITIDGTDFTHTTGPSTNANNSDTHRIANQLKNEIDANVSYVVSRTNNIIKVSRVDEADFTITSSDGIGDRGIETVYKQVDDITDLPKKAFNGFKVEIAGDTSTNDDNYWVTFTAKDESLSAGSYGEGSWVEDIAPSITTDIDPSTMPLVLINDAVDSFTLEEFTWNQREVGDGNTNPPPSFVGDFLNDVFFFKNRLGFISDENIIFSSNGEFGNFWRTTVTTLLDSDPIDAAVSHTKVSILRHAIATTSRLILFSDRTQFALKGEDILTNQTISITPVTNFESNLNIQPSTIGSYTYFGFQSGSNTRVREYYLDNLVNDFDQNEITAHVPSLIPSSVKVITGTTSEDQIVVIPKGGGEFFLYSYYWNGKEKAMSSWSRHEIEGEILSGEFIDSNLYLLISNNGYITLQFMPFEQGLSDGIVVEEGTTSSGATMVISGLTDTQYNGIYANNGDTYNGSDVYELDSGITNALIRRSSAGFLYWQIVDSLTDDVIAVTFTEATNPWEITLWNEN